MQDNQHPIQDQDPVIYSYTRAQAIEDGVLVDLTQWARETGFTIPVACTAAVWCQYVKPPRNTRDWGQSERGRAHDLLQMCYLAIKAIPESGDQLRFKATFLNKKHRHETVTLKAICGPGDNVEPVLTLLLLDED